MWDQLPKLVRLIILAGGALVGSFGVKKGIEHLRRKRVFVSFAIEDKNIRDLLVGQSKNKKTPFDFVDMSVKEPWDSSWKTQCRDRIRSCDGVIVLVSKNTLNADGVHWEIKCAKNEGLPMRAIYAYKDAKGCDLPSELTGQHIYKWSWQNIDKFLEDLE